MDNDSEYEPESGNSSHDSDKNDMDCVPQTPPDHKPSTSTQSQSVRGRKKGMALKVFTRLVNGIFQKLTEIFLLVFLRSM